jgi:hypothetical protein
MVLEIRPYAGEIQNDIDARGFEERRRANAASLEDGRSVKGTGRDDHLARSRNVESFIIAQRADFHQGRPDLYASRIHDPDHLMLDE